MSDEYADRQGRDEGSPAPGTGGSSGDELLAAALALVAEAEATLNDVERALERLEQGTYAQCEVCGGDIDAAALASSPTVRRCPAHLYPSDRAAADGRPPD